MVGQIKNLVWVLVGVASAMVLIGFLGCCGAATENRCLLGIVQIILFAFFCETIAVMLFQFIGLIGVVFLAKIGIGIALFVRQEDMKNIALDQFGDLLDADEGLMDTIQDQVRLPSLLALTLTDSHWQYDCCGLEREDLQAKVSQAATCAVETGSVTQPVSFLSFPSPPLPLSPSNSVWDCRSATRPCGRT